MAASSPGGGFGGGGDTCAGAGSVAAARVPGLSVVKRGRGVDLSGGGVGTIWQARMLASAASKKAACLAFLESLSRRAIVIL